MAKASIRRLAALATSIAVLACLSGWQVAAAAQEPAPVVQSPEELAIATARAHLAKTAPGPAQFKLLPAQRGYRIQADHAAGYRTVLTLSADFRVLSIGPKLPIQQQRYPTCCGFWASQSRRAAHSSKSD